MIIEWFVRLMYLILMGESAKNAKECIFINVHLEFNL